VAVREIAGRAQSGSAAARSVGSVGGRSAVGVGPEARFEGVETVAGLHATLADVRASTPNMSDGRGLAGTTRTGECDVSV
jgi:hypothetical protein